VQLYTVKYFERAAAIGKARPAALDRDARIETLDVSSG
jgi:hypothetical protein